MTNENPAKKPDKAESAEHAIRHSQARFAGILSIAADAIISVDDRQRITLFNEGAEHIFGYSRHEIMGQPLELLIPERFRRTHSEHLGRFRSGGVAARRMGERQEIFALHKGGHEFPAEASISVLEIDGERTFTVVLRDVTERKASEAALRESEQRLWAFLNNNSVIGWMKDEEGRYVFLSGTFQRRFAGRLGNWMGKTDSEIWPRDTAEAFRRGDELVLAENRSIEVLNEIVDPDGSRSWWLSHKFPFRDAKSRRFVGGLGVDISERIEAEEALARSHAELESRVDERTRELRREMLRYQEAQAAVARLQRMEALGQLTGGVSHDFNNLLTVISGNLQLISMSIEDPKLKTYLEEAERACEMGARLNQRLMTFAKQRRLTATEVNLNDQVISVRELLRRSLGESISLTVMLSDELWPVKVDPSEIENALVNLAINARDAMPAGGELTVATRNIAIDASHARPEEGLVTGNYVLLSIADTGTGIPPEIQARVFEPFFTTKGHGKGTGLGLATIYGFVKQSGGHINLESEVGRGTTINIYLPKLEATAKAAATTSGSGELARARGEVILVVEDHPEVRRVTLERLKALGYRTLEASSGLEALATLEQQGEVDLMFSDIVMPGGMSGFELARRVAERWPSLKVLLTSGYTGENTEQQAEGSQASLEILAKPYSQAALAHAIARALGQPPAQARDTGAVNT